jgi:3-oxoacyl-[acyl-carrier protein] reductase
MLKIDLSGKIALVTGATGELGRVMVRTLAAAGADVVVHYYRNETMARQLVREVETLGCRALAVQADITSESKVMAMRDQVHAKLSPPGIIVNNAVVQYSWKAVLDQPVEDFQSQFDSCVLHNVLMSKAFVPAMIQARQGRVIGINTECAMQCTPGQGAYASAKRGMDGVLRVLAREVGPHGVTVNQVAPGWTISENKPADIAPKAYVERVALGRRGTDQEIANVVAFLASDLSSFITGAYVPVCGGNVMPSI